ncbi:diguanylate cyclase [Crocosphaera sp.]|uniref:diguanylate cyclase n=1 Tax=Crocosphaera sp. TaxID=2729996 RepID=UPI003F206E85|nr:diguanylate cyclase [Crocosphaera sp.]
MKNCDPFNPEEFLILVVDDIRKNLQLLIEILDTSGYGTTFALSGKQALERIEVTEPDLILLDLMMPEMNGLEVCKRLKENPKTEQIPIIFLTAATETHYLVKAFKFGAVDYVTKPFRTPELLARVKIHLDLKKTKDKLEKAYQEMKRTKDELETAYQEMKRLAATDELTGIRNRRSIFELGKEEFERGQRYYKEKDKYTFSVLMIDIDKFKTINDSYGHDVGDEAIKMMVRITLNCIRKVDYLGRLETEKEALKKKEELKRLGSTIEEEIPTEEGHLGRLGGEEFVVILPHTNLKGAKIVAQRVCEAMTQESLQVEDETVTITVSVGVATYDPKDKKIDDVLKRADTALFAAKANGRNRVAVMDNQQLKLGK